MPDERDDEGSEARADPKDERRVTLDFTGPPLSLPADADADAEPALTLDLDAEDDDPGRAGPTPPPAESGSDGWATERSRPPPAAERTASVVRRSPLPPAAGRRLPDASDSVDALDLVEQTKPRPSSSEVDLASEMAERYGLGDFTGALRSAELLLGRDPEHAEARRYARSSRERLEQIYTSRLGAMTKIPVVTVPGSEVRWLGLDHRAGFLLSRIDGLSPIHVILDVSGMPRLDTLKTLSELLDAGAIRLEG